LLRILLRWRSRIAYRYMIRWTPCMYRKMGSPIKNRIICSESHFSFVELVLASES
jgi:hypothetical protein